MPHSLTGLDNVTFNENTVNAAPQVIDENVVFTSTAASFDGGRLTVSGLKTEDRVSIASGATIYLSGGVVYYDADGAGAGVALAIGTASGGVGSTFTVTFNADATAVAIDALIQSLTYANVSNSPITSRTLTIDITDAAGDSAWGASAEFTRRTGTDSPFFGILPSVVRAPTLVDLDGDGDFDLVSGTGSSSALVYFENTGTASAASFVQRTGTANPFDGIDVAYLAAPTFADLDGDGDLDAVVGGFDDSISYLENTGTGSAPAFVLRTGSANPFNSLPINYNSRPALADLDGDGDLDAVVGDLSGALSFFENTGTAALPVFSQRFGTSNPVNLVAVGYNSAPAFADVDGDGDLDLLVGNGVGVLTFFRNEGTAASPLFVERTGALNPFGAIAGSSDVAAAFVDLDGDGDPDLLINNNLAYFEGTQAVTIGVTPQTEPPAVAGLPSDVTVTEDVTTNLNLSAATLTDADTAGAITVTLTASAGTMTASSAAGVTVTGSGTGVIVLVGTAVAIDGYLNVVTRIRYTGAANANGDNAATITVTANDGTNAVTLGVVNIDITAVDDPMTLTGIATSATFAENAVNAASQLIDSDVTFVDGDSNYAGGTLTVAGLLAEDRVSIADGATISLVGGSVYYDADGAGGATAVAIGTASGGSGSTFTVTFNAAASSAAVDALIQSLTYANTSDTPTASRTLTLNVTDAVGDNLAGGATLTFAARTGALNPAEGIDVGLGSTPTLVDLDGDGDLDMAVGRDDGAFSYFENTGSTTAPVFTERTGAANPLSGVAGTFDSIIAFGDFDGDGDQDALVGGFTSPRYYENTGTASAATFVERTGAANPFSASGLGTWSAPAFADLDNDGDLDVLVGTNTSQLLYFENTGSASTPVFVQRTGAADPFNGADSGYMAKPAFADVDGDGDLDVVVGDHYGEVRYFENTGTVSAPAFVQRTGAANPFSGIDVGYTSAPALGDLDGDGALDIIVGQSDGQLLRFEATPPGAQIVISVTAENDVPRLSGLPSDVTVTEDVATAVDLSAATISDPDTPGVISVTLTASSGTLTAVSGGGVTVSGSGSAAVVLGGTVSAIDAFLNSASAVHYTGPADVDGDNAATITVTTDDGTGVVTLGTVNVDITAVDDAMSLTGLAATVSLGENTVNATPQLIDADVAFVHGDHEYLGGVLRVSGLLAEDRVSIASGATISASGGTVYYDADGAGAGAAVAIGAVTGGSGSTFTVTFTAAATTAAIDALIQSLTYANVSDTPTAMRTLTLQILDAMGDSLVGYPAFTARTGAANPLNGFDVGNESTPTFGDLDGDGDMDAVVGDLFGGLFYFENTGTAVAPVFVQRSGGANPFAGVDEAGTTTPTLVDLDGDGDLDAVIGNSDGVLLYLENTGSTSMPAFTSQTGAANPFNGVDVGLYSAPAFTDLDGDGDMDLVLGRGDGQLSYFENTGAVSAPVFVERAGAANPFDGFDAGYWSRPSLADVDGDGDTDLVLGKVFGSQLIYLVNVGTATAPVFRTATSAADPFGSLNVGGDSAPALVDLDGDGDMDLVAGWGGGDLRYFQNTTSGGQQLTVSVTAQNDAPSATGLPTDVTVIEDTASNLNLSAITVADVDSSGPIEIVLTASAGTMTASSGGGVTVTGSGTGVLTLAGGITEINDFLDLASNIQFTGALDASGDNAATITVTSVEGSDTATLGTVNVDITAVNDPVSLTGLLTAATFGENLVNRTPQLLDADVTYAHVDNEVPGSVLTVSGLLAEDRLSLANGANVSLSGGTVYYDADGAGAGAAVAVGTATGGSGATFSITFNAAATVAAVDAVIQSLTYANVSDTPTATRTLVINVTDSAGDNLAGAPTYVARTGTANPLNGVDLGFASAPALADLDNDGDLDALVGDLIGALAYFENTGTASAPVFTARTGAANPFNGVDVGFAAVPVFVDLDGDGDRDALVGESSGTLRYYENTGTVSAPVFTARIGAANPLSGVSVGFSGAVSFADLDNDGDRDALVGENGGTLRYYENTGSAGAPVFTERTGGANPFNGVDVGFLSTPAFADIDGDGDLDAVIGESEGSLRYYENTGTAAAPVFTARTGADNPFNGVDLGRYSAPTFADLDGDGDLDALIGEYDGVLNYFENTTLTGVEITVTVTAEADGPTPFPDTLSGTSGNDTVKGLGGDDTLDGGDGNDFVEGGDGDDVLTGGAGNDRMDGGAGADDMAGGTGDDLYYVSDPGDVVDETGGSGYDTVRSMITYTLTADVERLELLFSASINGTGNGLDNVIVGNTAANVLTGLAGADTLVGHSGNDTLRGGDDGDSLDGGAGDDLLEGGEGVDTLTGGAGVDRLDGGTGADAMSGGASGDVYVVDNLGDSIAELAGGGTDAVEASITYTLGAELENLQLTGGSAINGTGNGLSNVITGNGAANMLSGGAGSDALSGMGGNDLLIGGAGGDTLTGGLGADAFVFSNADIGAKVETDRILDLVFADGDVVDLSGIDANSILGGDQAFAWVTKFSKVAGQALMTYANGVTTIALDVNGDGKADFKIAITGDHTGTKGNLYTGVGDTDGGWVL